MAIISEQKIRILIDEIRKAAALADHYGIELSTGPVFDKLQEIANEIEIEFIA